MNLHELLDENLEYKEGYLPLALYPNKMKAGEENETYYARLISRGTCSLKNLAEELVLRQKNFGLSAKQIEDLIRAFNAIKLIRVSEGFAVDDELIRMNAKVKGVFSSKNDTFSPDRHKVMLCVGAKRTADKLMAEARGVIRQGNTINPTIISVHDLESQGGDVLTKGGFLEIKGTKIMITGTHGDVGLYFENVESPDKTVKLSIEKLGANTSTRLACVVPTTLEAGKYQIKVVTQYSGSKRPKNEPQSYTLRKVYTVA